MRRGPRPRAAACPLNLEKTAGGCALAPDVVFNLFEPGGGRLILAPSLLDHLRLPYRQSDGGPLPDLNKLSASASARRNLLPADAARGPPPEPLTPGQSSPSGSTPPSAGRRRSCRQGDGDVDQIPRGHRDRRAAAVRRAYIDGREFNLSIHGAADGGSAARESASTAFAGQGHRRLPGEMGQDAFEYRYTPGRSIFGRALPTG